MKKKYVMLSCYTVLFIISATIGSCISLKQQQNIDINTALSYVPPWTPYISTSIIEENPSGIKYSGIIGTLGYQAFLFDVPSINLVSYNQQYNNEQKQFFHLYTLWNDFHCMYFSSDAYEEDRYFIFNVVPSSGRLLYSINGDTGIDLNGDSIIDLRINYNTNCGLLWLNDVWVDIGNCKFTNNRVTTINSEIWEFTEDNKWKKL